MIVLVEKKGGDALDLESKLSRLTSCGLTQLAFSEFKCLRLYNNRVLWLTSKFPSIPDVQ